MDRVAVFVDAGYLFAQGSALLAGKKLPRSEVIFDHERAIEALTTFSTQLTNADILRVYWYDGTSTGPTAQHLTLAHLANTKVRLGFVNSHGEQKGVDSLIVTDMIALARNRAICDAVLLSGDEDLRVGVQQAQEFGVRVHLIGIKPSRGSQSLFLLQESDTTHEWGPEQISTFMTCKAIVVPGNTKPVPTSVAPIVVEATASTTVPPLDEVAGRIAMTLDATELPTLLEAFDGTKQLPRDIDRLLLTGGRIELNRDLEPSEKRQIRDSFVRACRLRLGL